MFCIVWDIKLFSLGKTDSILYVSGTTVVNRLLYRVIVQAFFWDQLVVSWIYTDCTDIRLVGQRAFLLLSRAKIFQKIFVTILAQDFPLAWANNSISLGTEIFWFCNTSTYHIFSLLKLGISLVTLFTPL